MRLRLSAPSADTLAQRPGRVVTCGVWRAGVGLDSDVSSARACSQSCCAFPGRLPRDWKISKARTRICSGVGSGTGRLISARSTDLVGGVVRVEVEAGFVGIRLANGTGTKGVAWPEPVHVIGKPLREMPTGSQKCLAAQVWCVPLGPEYDGRPLGGDQSRSKWTFGGQQVERGLAHPDAAPHLLCVLLQHVAAAGLGQVGLEA